MRILLLFILLVSYGFAQEDKTVDVVADTNSDFEKIKQDRLIRIRKELVGIQNKIYEGREGLKSTSDSVEKFKLEVALAKLKKQEDKLRLEFIETATNISIDFDKDKSKDKKATLSENVQAILQPAFDTIRAISQRPREIQILTNKKEDLTKKIDQALSAKSILKKELEGLSEKKLLTSYKKSIRLVNDEIKKLEIEKEDTQFSLIKLEKQKGSVVSKFSNAIFEFLSTKGKNLFIALVTFVFFFWLFRLGKNKFISLFFLRVRKRTDYVQNFSWMARPLRVIYSVISIILAVFMGILALYTLDDWVLVTLIIFVIGGVVWSLRSYLPIFVEQSKIVLNLGAIREGERIVFNGLPWQIKNLGYYCRLVNPALKGGHLRVNTRELIHHTSRPINENEPWFPTKGNDWVVLSDGTYGKVTMQTPEQVIIKLIGGQQKFLSSSEFLGLSPINLSQDFGIELIFGIDYDHQDKVLSDYLTYFKKGFNEKLAALLPGMFDDFKDITVEFNSAGANSLDYRFFLRCNGKLASQKLFLERRVQAVFVDICNENNLIIPFSQLRVHMDK